MHHSTKLVRLIGTIATQTMNLASGAGSGRIICRQPIADVPCLLGQDHRLVFPLRTSASNPLARPNAGEGGGSEPAFGASYAEAHAS